MLSRHAPPTSDESSGIIVLSMTRQVLHANQSALGWARLLAIEARPQNSVLTPALLPRSLEEFSQRVLIQLEKRIAADDWTQFEMRQIVQAANREILLRGFGLPDKVQRQRSRILLALQPFTRDILE